MEERILVAIDGSNNSIDALEEAVRLAGVLQSRIILVNVQPSFYAIHKKLFIKEKHLKEYQQELFLDATWSAVQFLDAKNIHYELILRVGDPVQQICDVAEELNVRYIIMGSRGMGLIRGTVLGAVSNGVLHESLIPILIIPHKHKK